VVLGLDLDWPTAEAASGKDGKQSQRFGCLITMLHETCRAEVHVTNTRWCNITTSNTKKITVTITEYVLLTLNRVNKIMVFYILDSASSFCGK
jgi:hypothetical protein